MGFELRIAVMRDPLAGRSATEPAAGTTTTIVLNGTFDAASSQQVLNAIGQEFAGGANSMIVDFECVETHGIDGLGDFTRGIMNARAAGRHVQIKVRDTALHATMGSLPDARDWLIANTNANTDGARLAIHLDGPSGHP